MSLHNQFHIDLSLVQRLISIPLVLHLLVYGLLVQKPHSFTRVFIFVYCFFLIWPIISLCTLFNRISFMILFLIYHINCYFACINIIDVDLSIRSILFYTWHNLLRSLHCLRYLNFFQSCLMSLLEIIQKLYFLVTIINLCSFSFVRILIFGTTCLPRFRRDLQFEIVLIEHLLLLEHLQLVYMTRSLYLFGVSKFFGNCFTKHYNWIIFWTCILHFL